MTEKQYREHIKHKLSRYNSLTHERMQMEEQLAKLEATMTSPKVQNLDGMPKGSAGGNAMDNLVAELVNLQGLCDHRLQLETDPQHPQPDTGQAGGFRDDRRIAKSRGRSLWRVPEPSQCSRWPESSAALWRI